MIRTLSILFNRAKDILQTEGLISLLRRSFPFLARYYLFQCGTFYLYDQRWEGGTEADFMPEIQDFTSKVVSNNQQADELATATGFDFRSYFANARRSLDKGAVAFCFFVDGELAYIGWAAMSEEAKKTIDSLPYRVDFANNEGCIASNWTNPKYRGRGLMTYGHFKGLQFLKERGITVSRSAIATGNVAPQRVHDKFDHKIYAKGRYLKILWLKFWKETPVTQ